ncbi:hypothetical protein [Candidatus Amarolinea dominans]|uniref:hypothetical protein n=1 Tax=Candidatus Amarolinea dominans TaxID=3140696 RepID=UPI001E0915DE|nr:hypothetical protein [Anaerolineae bacterium]
MRSQTNRKAIIISALLTAFVLTLVTGGILLSDRLAASAAAPVQALPVAAAVTPAADPAVQPADSNATIAAYEAQLQEAYQALQDAYAQINALQAGQNQPISGFGSGYEHEHESEHEGEHDHD